MVVKQFQDGGRPPFWKSIYQHISVKNHPIFMKFAHSSRFWLGERHVIKNEKVALDRLRVRQNVFLVYSLFGFAGSIAMVQQRPRWKNNVKTKIQKYFSQANTTVCHNIQTRPAVQHADILRSGDWPRPSGTHGHNMRFCSCVVRCEDEDEARWICRLMMLDRWGRSEWRQVSS